jgi:hypothetical protein
MPYPESTIKWESILLLWRLIASGTRHIEQIVMCFRMERASYRRRESRTLPSACSPGVVWSLPERTSSRLRIASPAQSRSICPEFCGLKALHEQISHFSARFARQGHGLLDYLFNGDRHAASISQRMTGRPVTVRISRRACHLSSVRIPGTVLGLCDSGANLPGCF